MSERLVHRKFTFPDGCNCTEITIRETTGIDEQEAALAVETRGARSTVYAELVRLSVVEVDGQKVTQPFLEAEKWNSRTRTLVMKAYETVNRLEDEEIAAFIAASQDVTPGLAVVESGPARKQQKKEAHTAGSGK